MKNSDVYGYSMDAKITLGTPEVITYRPENPKASLRALHLVIKVDGCIDVPCDGFLFIEAITLNSIPIEWLSINENPASKFVRLREASYDLGAVARWSRTPRIWPSIRLYPNMKGVNRVVLKYTGKIPEGGQLGEVVNVNVKFTGPR